MADQIDNINHELIRWAIERSGRDVEALARGLPWIKRWEAEGTPPTLKQLEMLAKKTWTPLGYFFLAEPPEEKLPVPDFRTARDAPLRRPSPNLIDTLHAMQRRQWWMREYLVEMGHEPLAFVGEAKPTDKVESVAKSIRRTLGMSDGWAGQIGSWTLALGALREAAEAAGIFVVINGVVGNDTHRTLDPGEFRGFVLADEYAPLVFLNGADARSAQMFTLAHELAHLWIGEGGIFDLPDLEPDGDRREVFCNRVAAEFLVPAVELSVFWQEAKRQPEPFQAIARQFKVSPIVAARRAFDLNMIGREAFFDFYRAYQVDERRKAERARGGGDFYNNQNVRLGKRFARAVALAAKEGRLGFREAYSLTGLQGATFDRYARALGISL